MGRHAAEHESKAEDKLDGLIHSVMIEQKAEANRESFPELAPVEAEADAPAKGYFRARGTTKAARGAARAAHFSSGSTLGRLKARLLAYRPKRTHVLWALVLLVAVWRPWLIPGALFVSFWVALIIYLTVGSDRFLEWMNSAWYRLVQANPERADKLRAWADAFALRFDAFLDRLPESWAEKLALPDFSERRAEQEALNDRPDPFERLKTPEVYRG